MAHAIQLNSSPTVLGNDGNWVTYSIQVGNPPKSFNVLPSTVLPDTWTINTGVCSSLTGNALTNCQANRGFLFSPSMSSTWEYLFDNSSLAFSLGIEGGYGWNPRDGGSFGHDTLILTSEKGSIPVSGSVIGSMNTNATATGFLGLASKQVTLTNPYTNETSITNSTLQILRDTGVIPSMSFSYSAGAIYNKTTGLLILGGYDSASYVPNTVPFTFAADVNNVLSVGLLSISATVDGKTTLLSDSSEQALIDSTVSELWLPETWCDAFETMFNLTFNANNQLYTLSDEAIASNNKKNPTVTIKIANTQNANRDTVSINFPWSAFNNTYISLSNSGYTRPYFSIRRTTGPYTLGRTFLQEAVLTVDHERRNFSVSQVVDLGTNPQPNLVDISSISSTSSSGGGGNSNNGGGTNSPTPNSAASSSGGGISGGAIGGIVVAVLVLAAAAIAGFFLLRRRRRNRYSRPEEAKADTPGPQRLPPAAFNEKSAPTEMPTPQPGSSNDPLIDYHAAQRQNIKAAMAMSNTDTSELDGDLSNGERAQSPLPVYVQHGSPIPGITQNPHAAELPATAAASELHSEHASPMSSPPFSPPISELAPSPGDEAPLATAADMGWGTEPQSPHSAESISLSPVRGGVRLQDVRRNRGGPNSPDIAGNSNRGSELLEMRATSGPLGTGLGIQDRETSENLRRQDSTRSRNSDVTLVSGTSTLPTSSVSAALHPAPLNPRRPATRD